MTKLYDEYLAPCGLKIMQYSLLRHLDAVGTASVSQLARAMRLERTTLVRNLLPLEKAELIEDTSALGSRSRELKLTEAGKARCEEATNLWNVAQRHVEKTLGKEVLVHLTELLSAVENLN
jgi:DNA-binding MarR family transcriptional regulator